MWNWWLRTPYLPHRSTICNSHGHHLYLHFAFSFLFFFLQRYCWMSTNIFDILITFISQTKLLIAKTKISSIYRIHFAHKFFPSAISFLFIFHPIGGICFELFVVFFFHFRAQTNCPQWEKRRNYNALQNIDEWKKNCRQNSFLEYGELDDDIL